MTKAKAKKNIVANVFGVLGYISTVFVWLWAVILIIPWFMSLQSVKDFTTPHQATFHPLVVQYHNPPQIIIFFVVAFAFMIVILGFVAAARMPKEFVKATSRTTHKAAGRLAVELTHHHPVEKKKLLEITENIVWATKLCLVVIPFAGIYFASIYVPIELDPGLAIGIGACLAAWPTLWFILQYITAKITHSETI